MTILSWFRRVLSCLEPVLGRVEPVLGCRNSLRPVLVYVGPVLGFLRPVLCKGVPALACLGLVLGSSVTLFWVSIGLSWLSFRPDLGCLGPVLQLSRAALGSWAALRLS